MLGFPSSVDAAVNAASIACASAAWKTRRIPASSPSKNVDSDLHCNIGVIDSSFGYVIGGESFAGLRSVAAEVERPRVPSLRTRDIGRRELWEADIASMRTREGMGVDASCLPASLVDERPLAGNILAGFGNSFGCENTSNWPQCAETHRIQDPGSVLAELASPEDTALASPLEFGSATKNRLMTEETPARPPHRKVIRQRSSMESQQCGVSQRPRRNKKSSILRGSRNSYLGHDHLAKVFVSLAMDDAAQDRCVKEHDGTVNGCDLQHSLSQPDLAKHEAVASCRDLQLTFSERDLVKVRKVLPIAEQQLLAQWTRIRMLTSELQELNASLATAEAERDVLAAKNGKLVKAGENIVNCCDLQLILSGHYLAKLRNDFPSVEAKLLMQWHSMKTMQAKLRELRASLARVQVERDTLAGNAKLLEASRDHGDHVDLCDLQLPLSEHLLAKLRKHFLESNAAVVKGGDAELTLSDIDIAILRKQLPTLEGKFLMQLHAIRMFTAQLQEMRTALAKVSTERDALVFQRARLLKASETMAHGGDLLLELSEQNLANLRKKFPSVEGKLLSHSHGIQMLTALLQDHHSSLAIVEVERDALAVSNQILCPAGLVQAQMPFGQVEVQNHVLSQQLQASTSELDDVHCQLISLRATHESMVKEHQLVVSRCDADQDADAAEKRALMEELETLRNQQEVMFRGSSETSEIWIGNSAGLSETLAQFGTDAEASSTAMAFQQRVDSLKESLQMKVQRLQQELVSHASLREELSKSHLELQQKLSDHQRSAASVEVDRDRRAIENEILQEQLVSFEAEHQGKLVALEAEREQLVSESAAQNADHEQLRSEYAAQNAECEQLISECAAQKAEHEQLVSECAAQIEQHTLTEAELDRVIADSAARKAKHALTEAERDRLAQAGASFQQKSAAVEVEQAAKATLQAERDQLIADLQELKSTAARTKVELDTVKLERQEISEEKSNHINNLEEHLEVLRDTHRKYEDMEARCESLQEQLTKTTDERNLLEADSLHLRNVIQSRERAESDRQDALVQARGEIESLIKERDEESWRQELTMVEAERDNLDNAYQQLQDKLRKQEAAELALRRTHDGLEKTIQRLEEELDGAHERRHAEVVASELSEAQVAEAERDTSLPDDGNELNRNTRANIRQSLKDREQVAKELQDRQVEIEHLNEKLQALTAENQELRELQKQEQSGAHLQQELEEERRQNFELQEQLQALQATIDTRSTTHPRFVSDRTDDSEWSTTSKDNFADPASDTLVLQLRQQQLDTLNNQNQQLQRGCALRDAAELTLRRQLEEEKVTVARLKEEHAACLDIAPLHSSTADSLQKLQKDLASKEAGQLQLEEINRTLLKGLQDERSGTGRLERELRDMELQLEALRGEVAAKGTRQQSELVDLKMLEATQNSTGDETYVDLGVESPVPTKGARKISFFLEDQDESTISQIQSQGLMTSPSWHEAESLVDGRSNLTPASPQSEDFEFERQPSTEEEKDDCPLTPVVSTSRRSSEVEMIENQAHIEDKSSANNPIPSSVRPWQRLQNSIRVSSKRPQPSLTSSDGQHQVSTEAMQTYAKTRHAVRMSSGELSSYRED